MFVTLSTGRILNLSQVAWIDLPSAGGIKIRTASGQHDVCSNATEADYQKIVDAIRESEEVVINRATLADPANKDANDADGKKNTTRTQRTRTEAQ